MRQAAAVANTSPVTDGLVIVDKPAGWTSHDVVARCRKIFGQKRVGHAGTLDPDATGVLLVGLGGVTRLMRFLTPLRKAYIAELVLGTATSTLDASGSTTGTWDMSSVTLDDVRAAAAKFVGHIEQVPPMVSAVQVGGRRLHEIARAGEEIEREPRPVTVYRYDVAPTEAPGVFAMDVECSSGTYVRTLAADVGTALGGGAHLRNLRRTAIGPFAEQRAVPLEAVDGEHVLTPAEALPHLSAIAADEDTAAAVAVGKVLERDVAGAVGDGPWAVVADDGRLLAVYEAHKGTTIKPAVVLPRP